MFCEVSMQSFSNKSLSSPPTLKKRIYHSFLSKTPCKTIEISHMHKNQCFSNEVVRFWYKGGFVTSNVDITLKCCILRDFISQPKRSLHLINSIFAFSILVLIEPPAVRILFFLFTHTVHIVKHTECTVYPV